MIAINIEGDTQNFLNKLQSESYTSSRVINSANDYSKEKEDRDTEAVHRFLDTDLFKHIIDVK
jgi:hypothetical protein